MNSSAMLRGPMRRLVEPQVVFPILGGLLLVAIWVTTLGIVRAKRADTVLAAAVSSRELLGTYEAQVVRSLGDIDHTLRLVVYWHGRKLAAPRLAELKERGLLPSDLIFSVAVADAAGKLIDATRPFEAEQVSEQDYFKVQRDSPGFFVGHPPPDATGNSQLHFSRRLEDERGGFAGAVIVSVDADYFVSSYDTGKMGARGVVGLVGDEGVFRVRRSGDEVSSGTPIDAADAVRATADESLPVPVRVSRHDGIARWVVARELYGYPLTAVVGLSVDEQMAAADRASRSYLLWATAGSLAALALLTVLGRLSGQLMRGRLREAESKREYAERLEHLAYHDGLTGLPNRSQFSRLLAQKIEEAGRLDTQVAVAFLDLDRFKQINDSLGHEAGDELLREIARRLANCVRASDTVARLGGDEFVVIMPDMRELRNVADVARKILAQVAQPLVLGGQELRVTASIGISTCPRDGVDEQTLTRRADIAMYQAKSEGKNNYQFYSTAMDANSLERLSLESSLRHALERDEFRLHYQPKRDILSGRITGLEALLRWEHPDLGTVAPMRFIPIAEDTGIIVPIGRWVLKAACAQNVRWRREHGIRLCIAVNLTARQFLDERLVEEVAEVLAATGMDPQLLELEIPENLLTREVANTLRILNALKDLGVRVAIDDFGTGYSSLATLGRFPIDTIKIDRSLVQALDGEDGNSALADAIIAMGRHLSMTVVAQGVETRDQAAFLRAHACDELQGFYVRRPLSVDAITELLLDRTAGEDTVTFARRTDLP